MALRRLGVELGSAVYTTEQLVSAVKALGKEASGC
jgi:hypothetical protein